MEVAYKKGDKVWVDPEPCLYSLAADRLRPSKFTVGGLVEIDRPDFNGNYVIRAAGELFLIHISFIHPAPPVTIPPLSTLSPDLVNKICAAPQEEPAMLYDIKRLVAALEAQRERVAEAYANAEAELTAQLEVKPEEVIADYLAELAKRLRDGTLSWNGGGYSPATPEDAPAPGPIDPPTHDQLKQKLASLADRKAVALKPYDEAIEHLGLLTGPSIEMGSGHPYLSLSQSKPVTVTA